jgi:hypothetical protein
VGHGPSLRTFKNKYFTIRCRYNERLVTSGWTSFSSREYGFSVLLPWEKPLAGGGDNSTNYLKAKSGDESWSTDKFGKQDEPYPKYRFWIYAVRLKPNARPADKTDLFDAIKRKRESEYLMKKTGSKTVTWVGKTAEEITLEPADPSNLKLHRRAVFRILDAGSTYLVAGVRDGGGLAAKELDQFFDSFELLPESSK